MTGPIPRSPVGAAAALGLAAVIALGCRPDYPDPPVPARMAGVDPAIVARVDGLLERIRANPGDLEGRYLLARVYRANVFYEAAAEGLTQALELGLQDPRAWYYLGEAHERAGRPRAAVEALAVAVERTPSYAPASWRRGLLLLDLGEVVEAEASFERAAREDPADPGGGMGLARAALRRGDSAGAARRLEELLAAHPAHEPLILRLLARAYRGLGRAGEAAEAERLAGNREARLPDPWIEELESLREGYAAELDKAKAAARAGDYEAALARLQTLAESREVTAEVFTNLGLAYLATGRHEEAVEALEAALDRAPNAYHAHFSLAGIARLRMARQSEPAAREALRRQALDHLTGALEAAPASVDAWALRADLLAAGGDLDGAMEAYAECRRWDEENPEWPYRAGLALAEGGRWAAAAEAYSAAARLSPGYLEAARRAGLAFLMAGDHRAAQQALERALELEPGDPVLRSALARARAGAG